MSFITKAAVFVVEIEEFLPLDHDDGREEGSSGELGNPMQIFILLSRELRLLSRVFHEIQCSPPFC